MIPCLDTKDGRVVKGIQFQQLRDAGDPAELSEAYAAQGADEIVILDVGASPEGRSTQYDTIQQVRERVRIPIAAGGGLRKLDDARQLLKAGADKVTINTAAIKRPALVKDLADAFGSQCIVLAIDARRGQAGWDVLVNGGREAAGVKAVDWAQEAVTFGAGEILLTSWDRDGTRDGCDLELIEAVSNTVSVPVIASGGIGTFNHALDAVNAGADAILAASIFHDGEYTVRNVKDFLISNGCSIRQ
ncbi:MAG: imidazole glycerol phosphate synthase subunit HisF [Gemmatimonadota bacterium]|nr:imidazole glycerol phosphate synthase subunit HisF [Gemmatimonadota bacterium]